MRETGKRRGVEPLFVQLGFQELVGSHMLYQNVEVEGGDKDRACCPAASSSGGRQPQQGWPQLHSHLARGPTQADVSATKHVSDVSATSA